MGGKVSLRKVLEHFNKDQKDTSMLKSYFPYSYLSEDTLFGGLPQLSDFYYVLIGENSLESEHNDFERYIEKYGREEALKNMVG